MLGGLKWQAFFTYLSYLKACHNLIQSNETQKPEPAKMTELRLTLISAPFSFLTHTENKVVEPSILTDSIFLIPSIQNLSC